MSLGYCFPVKDFILCTRQIQEDTKRRRVRVCVSRVKEVKLHPERRFTFFFSHCCSSIICLANLFLRATMSPIRFDCAEPSSGGARNIFTPFYIYSVPAVCMKKKESAQRAAQVSGFECLFCYLFVSNGSLFGNCLPSICWLAAVIWNPFRACLSFILCHF